MKELILVALPIGNVSDLSPRARETLESVDGVLAEDTRKYKDFKKWANLKNDSKVVSFPSFTEKEVNLSKFLDSLEGDRWALVSDAGTPGISDPGAYVLRAARTKKIAVKAIPGPSALSLSLQITGGYGLPVVFAGFAPKKNKKDFFSSLKFAKTFLYFDSKHEVLDTLQYLVSENLGNQKITMLRELTKTHEEVLELSVSDLLKELTRRLSTQEPIGELSFVIEGLGEDNKTIKLNLEDLLEIRNSSGSTAAKLFSKISGVSRDEAYRCIEEAKKQKG